MGPGTIVIHVTNSSFVAFKKGNAAATANVGVENPTTFAFFTGSATQTIKVTKKPISYVDPFSHSALRYRVHLR